MPVVERRPAQTFRDLLVWQKAHQFVLAAYRLTDRFPDREKYCLVRQLRRAAVSIPANIAEGFGKRTKGEKTRFLSIAEGSLEESRYYLILAEDLSYHQTAVEMGLLEEVSRLMTLYTRAIESSKSH